MNEKIKCKYIKLSDTTVRDCELSVGGAGAGYAEDTAEDAILISVYLKGNYDAEIVLSPEAASSLIADIFAQL